MNKTSYASCALLFFSLSFSSFASSPGIGVGMGGVHGPGMSGAYGPGLGGQFSPVEQDNSFLNNLSQNRGFMSPMFNIGEGLSNPQSEKIFISQALNIFYHEVAGMKSNERYTDKDINEFFKNSVEELKKVKGITPDQVDKILNKVVEQAALDNRLEIFSKVLDESNIPRPSGYSDAVVVGEVYSKNSDIISIAKELKNKLGTENEAYKNALSRGLMMMGYSTEYSDKEKQEFLKEALENVELDQSLLHLLLHSEISSELYSNKKSPLLDLVSKYIDWEANPGAEFGFDNMICREAMRVANFGDSDRMMHDDLSEEGVEAIKQQHKGMKENIAKGVNQTLNRYISLGADINTHCLNGQSALNVIRSYQEEGLKFDGELEAALGNKKLANEPCKLQDTSPGSLDGLCDTANVVRTLSNILARNERISEKRMKEVTDFERKNHNFFDNFREKDCSVSVFDKHVTELNTTLERDLKVRIESGKVQKEYVLKDKEREEFIAEFKKILKIK